MLAGHVNAEDDGVTKRDSLGDGIAYWIYEQQPYTENPDTDYPATE